MARSDRYLFMAAHLASVLDSQTYAIIGCAMVVHRTLGSGFLEAVYREALQEVLTEQLVPFEAEVALPIRFRGRVLQTRYRADLICFTTIIVELKAIARLGSHEHAQVINYIKASGLDRALLINFGGRRLEYRRFVGPGAPSAVPSVSSVEGFVGPEAPSVTPSLSSVDRPSLPSPPV